MNTVINTSINTPITFLLLATICFIIFLLADHATENSRNVNELKTLIICKVLLCLVGVFSLIFSLLTAL